MLLCLPQIAYNTNIIKVIRMKMEWNIHYNNNDLWRSSLSAIWWNWCWNWNKGGWWYCVVFEFKFFIINIIYNTTYDNAGWNFIKKERIMKKKQQQRNQTVASHRIVSFFNHHHHSLTAKTGEPQFQFFEICLKYDFALFVHL